MLAGGATGSDCDSDNYLQFGRDILFVTTHLSDKLCYNRTVINNRQYVEIQVRTLDYCFILFENTEALLFSYEHIYISFKYSSNNTLSELSLQT